MIRHEGRIEDYYRDQQSHPLLLMHATTYSSVLTALRADACGGTISQVMLPMQVNWGFASDGEL